MSQGAGVRGYQNPPMAPESTPQAAFTSPLAALGATGAPGTYAPVQGDIFLQLVPPPAMGRLLTGVPYLLTASGSTADQTEVGVYEVIGGTLTRVATSGMATQFLNTSALNPGGSVVLARLHPRALAAPWRISLTRPTYVALMIGSVPAPPSTARLFAESNSHLPALFSSKSMPSLGQHLGLFTNLGGVSLPATIEPPPETIADITRPLLGLSLQRRILAYGDSITEGTPGTTDPAVTYPARLQGMLGQNAHVINSGVSGNRVIGTTGLRNATRLQRDAYQQFPAEILILAGSPDLANDGATAAALETDFALMLDSLQTNLPGIPITVMTVLPFGNMAGATPTKDGHRLTVNTWIRGGSGRGLPFIDLEPEFAVFDGGTGMWDMKAVYDRGDGQHPNALGLLALATQVWSQKYGSATIAPL